MVMAGKEAVCQILEAEGVRYLFGNPGSTEIPLLDALAGRRSIEYVLALHESVAVAMADGYARASGRPGVVSVHACPGTAHSLGNLYNAWVDGVPVVVLAGQQDSRLVLKEPFLFADLARLSEQFTKWSYQVSRPDELPTALRRAFKEAMSPPPRPVFISLPKNVLDETTDADIVPPSKYRVAPRIRGDSSEIKKAAELLVRAQKPMFIAGMGVARSAGVPELVKLAEMLAARVYGDPSAFPTGHPLCFGSFERRHLASLLKDCDVLLVVGHEMFSEFNYSPDSLLPAHVKAIHLDSNPWEIAKNLPLDAGILADPKTALRQLMAHSRRMLDATSRGAIEARLSEVVKANQQMREQLAREAQSWDGPPLRIGRIAQELREALDASAILVDEGPQTSMYVRKYFPCTKPGTYYTQRGGTLGWGLGAALGIKLAQPERRVVAVVGDGSMMFAPQALWTAAQRNIPVTVLVVNNGGYMAVKALSMAYGGRWAEEGNFVGADVGGIDYCKLAESLGLDAKRIEKPDEIRPALRWAIRLGKPALIEARVDPKDAGYGWPRIP